MELNPHPLTPLFSISRIWHNTSWKPSYFHKQLLESNNLAKQTIICFFFHFAKIYICLVLIPSSCDHYPLTNFTNQFVFWVLETRPTTLPSREKSNFQSPRSYHNLITTSQYLRQPIKNKKKNVKKLLYRHIISYWTNFMYVH